MGVRRLSLMHGCLGLMMSRYVSIAYVLNLKKTALRHENRRTSSDARQKDL